MRIGVIHNLLPGGAHRRLGEQLTHFKADVVEVCLSSAQPIRSDAHVIGFHAAAPDARRALRPPLRYLDLAALVTAWQRAARLLRRHGVDVVYANPCRYLQAPAGLLANLPPSLYFCDEPRRVDHDPVAVGSRNARTVPVYAPLYVAQRRLDGRAVARASRLVTNSAFSAAEIGRAYRRSAEVIPLGVFDRCHTAAPAAPAHILSVGALIPSKGHDLVIAAAGRAARRLPVLVIAPRPDREEADRLHAAARIAGVGLEIRIGVSDAELADAYAAAQATVYMARREPFGLVSVEAQAAGSPVIVAAEGGLPETIVPGQTGWAVPRTAAAIADKLDELQRPGRRDSMSAAGRERAGGASWAHSAEAVEAILEQLC